MTAHWKGRVYTCRMILLSLVLCAGCATKGAVPPVNGEPAPPSGRKVLTASSPEVSQSESILGIGDMVDIDVYRHGDLKKSLRIEENGKITYPLIGDIQAAGLSLSVFRNTLRDELSKFLVAPQVTVNIRSMRSQKVYVLGEVAKPGIFTVDGPMTALEAISLAGGFTTDAKNESVMVIRGDRSNPQLVKLDLESVLKEANLVENIELKGGDVIYVPPTFIADVSRFAVYLKNILAPILMIEQGIVTGDQAVRIIEGRPQNPTTINVNIP